MMSPDVVVGTPSRPGGLMRRTLAVAVDVILLALGLRTVMPFLPDVSPPTSLGLYHNTLLAQLQFIGITFIVAHLLAYLLYFGLFEGSRLQATPGKLLLSLRVTDNNGNRLSWMHALLRQAAKLLTLATLGLGFIPAGFSGKRALHDIASKTHVLLTES